MGSLFYKVAFAKREFVPDGAGNEEGKFVEQFQSRAEFKHLRGGETVMAARLQGRHTQIIRVRVSDDTRQITAGWQARDIRRNIAFNIRDVEWEVNRQFISLTCESGVSAG